MLEAAGIPVRDIEFVTVGGGIGSFVTVDYLRVCGVSPDRIRVLTQLEYPWQTYEYLTRVSQIPGPERLRSDSASRPDCIWGFPSYAFSEAFRAKSIRGFIAPLFQVLTEPIFTDYYTPKAGHVFTMLQRESTRIGYDELVDRGSFEWCGVDLAGGYFTILTPPAGASTTKRIAYRSRYVHIAVGYPGLKFLPDLQDYRRRYGDHQHVMNAYEPHENVYHELQNHPCTVVLRGGGIVASRVLQRLIDDRDATVLRRRSSTSSARTSLGSQGPSIFMRRKGGDGWAYQGFNYPKAVWGGQLKSRMRRLEGEDRAALYKTIGGTNTPKRKLWQKQLARGRKEGWYRTMTGEVDSVVPRQPQGTITRIKTSEGLLEIEADYIIDGTGLEADIEEHRLLADLLQHGGAGRNPIGRLDVERSFRGDRCQEQRGPNVRLRCSDPRRVLPRGGHVPGAADRGARGRGRPDQARFWQAAGPMALHETVAALGTEQEHLRRRVMVPTLAGRIQTRIFSLGVVGSIWLLIISPFLPQNATVGEKYQATFLVLGMVIGLGIGWECVYHVLQQFRWEKDWPALFGLVTAIPEGIPGVGAPANGCSRQRGQAERGLLRDCVRHGVAGRLDVRQRTHAGAVRTLEIQRWPCHLRHARAQRGRDRGLRRSATTGTPGTRIRGTIQRGRGGALAVAALVAGLRRRGAGT